MVEYYIFCFIFFLTLKQNNKLNSVVSNNYNLTYLLIQRNIIFICSEKLIVFL